MGLAAASPLGSAFGSALKDGMGYRTLGRTGLKISEVILGGGGINTTKTNLIRAALSQGINYVDTAHGYQKGNSEIALGQVMKAMGNRDRVFVASKASGLKHGQLKGASGAEVAKAVRGLLEESLKRLQTDYVDVYMAPHGCSKVEHTAYPGLQEAMDKLKEEGKIRFTGISTHTNYVEVSMAAIEGGYYDVLMPVISSTTLVPKLGQAAKDSYARAKSKDESPRRRRGRPILDMRDVLKAAKKANVGLISMKAAKEGFNPVAIHDQVVSEVAKDAALSFHQVAYRYVLDQPEVAGVNIGMGNLKHLREALLLPQKSLKG